MPHFAAFKEAFLVIGANVGAWFGVLFGWSAPEKYFGALSVWQEDFEWTLKMFSLLAALVLSVVSICMQLRKKK